MVYRLHEENPKFLVSFFESTHSGDTLEASNVAFNLNIWWLKYSPTESRCKFFYIFSCKVAYRVPGASTADWVDIYNRLYRERIIFLGQEIDDELANQIIGVMLVSVHSVNAVCSHA